MLGAGRWGQRAILNSMVQGKKVSPMTFEQRAEGGERTSQMDIWEKREERVQSH